MIVVLFDAKTGAALSIGSEAPPTIPDGMQMFVLDVAYERLGEFEWEVATRTMVPRRPTEVRVLTKRAFRGRFTMPEKVTLKLAATTHTDPVTRASLQVLEDELRDASVVNLDDPDTVIGVTTMCTVLVAAGQLPAAERDARIAELLASVTLAELRAGAATDEGAL